MRHDFILQVAYLAIVFASTKLTAQPNQLLYYMVVTVTSSAYMVLD